MTASIAGLGAALPPRLSQVQLWERVFRDRYADDRMARQVWHSAGIDTRHGVVDPAHEDVSEWGTRDRMRRFLTEALPLGKEAIGRALDEAGLHADQIGLFSVVSSTGYVTPGLDILLARDLGMRDDVNRLHLGHMGCYAALPALGAASDFVTARARPAVVLCVELTSLHVQPPSATERAGTPTPEDREQMVAHALFSDAAAATTLRPGASGLEIVDVAARTDPDTASMMTWDVTDHGFRMGLSPRVPDVLAEHARSVVEQLLDRHGLRLGDVGGWAIHPGGRRILEMVGDALHVSDDALESSYDVLREHGNCSSATVLLVLARVRATLQTGDWVVAMTFGPGLTVYAALLRVPA